MGGGAADGSGAEVVLWMVGSVYWCVGRSKRLDISKYFFSARDHTSIVPGYTLDTWCLPAMPIPLVKQNRARYCKNDRSRHLALPDEYAPSS